MDEILIKYGKSPSILLQTVNPTKVQASVRKFGIKTAKKAYLSQSITLAKIKKAYGEDTAYTLIGAWIENLADFLGFMESKKPNPSIIQELSELFYEYAYMLKLSELGYFFLNLKRGYYGQFYGCLDPQKLLSYLDVYLSERSEAVRQVNAQEQREAISNDEISERLKEYYYSLRNPQNCIAEGDNLSANIQKMNEEFGVELKIQNGKIIKVKD